MGMISDEKSASNYGADLSSGCQYKKHLCTLYINFDICDMCKGEMDGTFPRSSTITCEQQCFALLTSMNTKNRSHGIA